jgi:hypothetical protein
LCAEGLDKGLEGLLDTNEFLIDEDLDMSGTISDASRAGAPGSPAGAPVKQQASELLQGMEGLSARERNRLKRKAKALGRQDAGMSEAAAVVPLQVREGFSCIQVREGFSCIQVREGFSCIHFMRKGVFVMEVC